MPVDQYFGGFARLIFFRSGCADSFSNAEDLARHHRHHGNDPLLPSTKPTKPDVSQTPPALPDTLPSYMSVTVRIATEPISQERHAKLGPWVNIARVSSSRVVAHPDLSAGFPAYLWRRGPVCFAVTGPQYREILSSLGSHPTGARHCVGHG